jgi:hypothetical protein
MDVKRRRLSGRRPYEGAVFLLLAVVLITSSVAAQLAPGVTTTPEAATRSRVTVTVQELIQLDHRLTVPVGTEVVWRDAHFERVWFPSGDRTPRVERTAEGFKALFSTPGAYRGAFTIVGGHRSNDVYPLVVTVTER